MNKPVALDGSINSHGSGEIHSTIKSIIIEGKYITVVGDPASSDSNVPPHSNTSPSTGSSTVFAQGKKVHRKDDERECGATTVEGYARSVYIGD